MDWLVVGVLFALGLLPILYVSRAPNFLHDDVFYADAARSLIQQHFYGTNGHLEANMPPGLSAFIAAMCLASACGHVAVLRSMAVLQAIGFLLSYLFLRRVTTRAVAAAICLLLITSPIYFAVATEVVVAYFPYFVTTMGALLLAAHLESNLENRWPIAWTVCLGALTVASVLTASVGIALAGALLLRAALRYAARDGNRRTAWVFGASGALGMLAQLIWMRRPRTPLEWPLPGYPRPYLQQLLVKSGNQPDLGMAHFRDFLSRIAENAVQRFALLGELLTHHWIDAAWASAIVIAIIALVVIGWIWSVRQSGGEVHDWYFAGHELIYLLWPWSLELRFFLPIAPLAALYLWRGVNCVRMWIAERPRIVGLVSLPFSIAFLTAAAAWSEGAIELNARSAGLQARISVVLWISVSVSAAWLAWKGPSWKGGVRFTSGRPERATPAHSATQLLACVLVLGLLGVGLRDDAPIARANIDPTSGANKITPEAEAGIWLRSHTDPRAVIMARHLPITQHYSDRHEVWFPPTSDAQMLMNGIRRMGVDYVLVVHRDDNYYRPPDDTSFARLRQAYPGEFHVVVANHDFSVFETREGDSMMPARQLHSHIT